MAWVGTPSRIGCAGLDDAVEHTDRIERRVHYQFTAAGDGDGEPNRSDIVAHRTERIDDRIRVERPVLHDRPCIREHRVVRMHDAFRLPGRARREGEVNDAIGIGGARKNALVDARDGAEANGLIAFRSNLGQRVEPVDFLQSRQAAEHREDVVLAGIRTVTGLRKQSSGARALEQRDDLLDCVIAMQRCVADISHARAGEEHERGFDPARKPDRNAIAGAHTCLVEVLRQGIDPLQRGSERQARLRIAQGETVGSPCRRCREQAIERVRAPIAAIVEGTRAFDVL